MGILGKHGAMPESGAGQQVQSADEATQDRLWQLIYASAAQPDISNDALEMILRSARRRNAMLDVTGMLTLVEGSFLQVLEGSFENVHDLFDRIKVDRRHRHVRLLQSKPIARRTFPEWTMSPPSRTLREFADARDIDQFFDGIRPPFLLDDENLRHVLERFHTGAFAQTERWSSPSVMEHR